MTTTVLSSKGQVIIPMPIRNSHHWEPGQRLEVIDTADGILLRSAEPFTKTSLNEVVSCLTYTGKPKNLEEMQAAIEKGAKESGRDRG